MAMRARPSRPSTARLAVNAARVLVKFVFESFEFQVATGRPTELGSEGGQDADAQ